MPGLEIGNACQTLVTSANTSKPAGSCPPISFLTDLFNEHWIQIGCTTFVLQIIDHRAWGPGILCKADACGSDTGEKESSWGRFEALGPDCKPSKCTDDAIALKKNAFRLELVIGDTACPLCIYRL